MAMINMAGEAWIINTLSATSPKPTPHLMLVNPNSWIQSRMQTTLLIQSSWDSFPGRKCGSGRKKTNNKKGTPSLWSQSSRGEAWNSLPQLPLQLEPDHVAQPFNQMCSGVTSMGLKGDGLECILTLWPPERPVTAVFMVVFSVVLVGHVAQVWCSNPGVQSKWYRF